MAPADLRVTPSSPQISPTFVARASRRRPAWPRGPEAGAGILDSMSNRLQGARPRRASASASAAGSWCRMRASSSSFWESDLPGIEGTLGRLTLHKATGSAPCSRQRHRTSQRDNRLRRVFAQARSLQAAHPAMAASLPLQRRPNRRTVVMVLVQTEPLPHEVSADTIRHSGWHVDFRFR